jgi:hypothetical protein
MEQQVEDEETGNPDKPWLGLRNRIDIPEALRLKLVELLNARLAGAFDLYAQLRQGHGT